MESFKIEGLCDDKSWKEIISIFKSAYENASSCIEEIEDWYRKENAGETECSIDEVVKSADYMAENGVEAMYECLHRLASMYICSKNKDCVSNPVYYFMPEYDNLEHYAEFRMHIPFAYIAETPDGVIYLGNGSLQEARCNNAINAIDDDRLSIEQMRVLVDYFEASIA